MEKRKTNSILRKYQYSTHTRERKKRENVGTLFNKQIYSAIAVFPVAEKTENPPKVKQEKV